MLSVLNIILPNLEINIKNTVLFFETLISGTYSSLFYIKHFPRHKKYGAGLGADDKMSGCECQDLCICVNDCSFFFEVSFHC